MVREGNAGTGVFGIRIMWPSMADRSKRLGRALGSNLDISEKFEKAFGEPRYIHVSRVDMVAQAVSRLRAEQSGAWRHQHQLCTNSKPGPLSRGRSLSARLASPSNSHSPEHPNVFNIGVTLDEQKDGDYQCFGQ